MRLYWFRTLYFLIIFICFYLGFTKLPFFGVGPFSKLFSALKDISLLLCISLFVLAKLRTRLTIRKSAINVVAVLYLFFILIYTVISPIGKSAIPGAFALGGPPLLFFIAFNLKLNNLKIYKIVRLCYGFLFLNIFIGFIIHITIRRQFIDYFGIYTFFNEFGVGVGNVYRALNGNVSIPRLIGLSLSPAETASLTLLIFLVGNAILKTRLSKILSGLLCLAVVILTYARSQVVGLFIGWFILYVVHLPKFRRFFILIVFGASVIITLTTLQKNPQWLIKNLDISAIEHFSQLVIRGPDAVLKNWKGLGVAMAGTPSGTVDFSHTNLQPYYFESEYFNLSLQIGIVGVVVFLILIFMILQSNWKRSFIMPLTQRKLTRAVILWSLSLLIGGVTFPTISSRLISNLMWVLLGICLCFTTDENIDNLNELEKH